MHADNPPGAPVVLFPDTEAGICPSGKYGYRTWNGAQKALQAQVRSHGIRNEKRPHGSITPYRCPWCPWWHLGHKKPGG